MNDHLAKAKAALEHAAAMDVDLTTDAGTLPPLYTRLLDIAGVQAAIAQAEALERIAERLDR